MRIITLFKTAVCVFLLSVAGMSTVSAQKLTTVSGNITKKKAAIEMTGKRVSWIVKAGGGVLYDYDYMAAGGAYNASFGMQYRLNRYGLYFGAKVGTSSVMQHDEYEEELTKMIPAIYVGSELGWLHNMSETAQFDLSLGINYMYLTKPLEIYRYGVDNSEIEENKAQGFNLQLGLGFWLRNVLLQFQYSPVIPIGGDVDACPIHRAFVNVGFRF